MDDQQARYAINSAMTEIREGYRTGDVERILAAYQPGFGDLSDGFPSFARGEAAIVLRERLRQMFARYDVEFIPLSMFIHVLGEQAVDCGWQEFRLRVKLDEEATSSLRMRYMQVWRRNEAGQWMIALFINNVDQTPMLVEDMLSALRSSAGEQAGLARAGRSGAA